MEGRNEDCEPVVQAFQQTEEKSDKGLIASFISGCADTLGQLMGGRVAEACGIVGVVGGSAEEAKDFLLEGLTILQNRGYDSAGLATMTDGSKGKVDIVTSKYASVQVRNLYQQACFLSGVQYSFYPDFVHIPFLSMFIYCSSC